MDYNECLQPTPFYGGVKREFAERVVFDAHKTDQDSGVPD